MGEVSVRIGLNAGEPIAEDDDFFGTAAQLADRICDRAEPGQVLVSNVVRELCAGKELTFNRHSDATLKGFDEQPEILRPHSSRLRTDYNTKMHAQANAPHAQALDHLYLIGAMRPAARAAFAAHVLPALRS